MSMFIAFPDMTLSLLAAAPAERFEWVVTIIVASLLFIGMLATSYTTRVGVIARATTKEAVRQPVFLLMMIIALAILIINTFLPFFTLGDDVKMLKDCGLERLAFAPCSGLDTDFERVDANTPLATLAQWACEGGAIDPEELRRWLERLEDAVSRDRFAFLSTILVVRGTKPEVRSV